jgi:predicted aconitase
MLITLIFWQQSSVGVSIYILLLFTHNSYCMQLIKYAALVPKVGVHISENRNPSIHIDAEHLIQEHLLPTIEDAHDIDSFFPVMGWLCGKMSDGRIPIITGFDSLPKSSVNSDNLKAFCAAFGTTGTGPLFHMAHITPEAQGKGVIDDLMSSCGSRRVIVTKDELRLAYQALDGHDDCDDEIHLVALGNPHLSLRELEVLSKMINSDDRPKSKSVNVIATLGRHVYNEGLKMHYVQDLERYGISFINDTCWCMMLDPPSKNIIFRVALHCLAKLSCKHSRVKKS